MVDFGSLLKDLRLKSGLTQKQLADKIGITKSVISYYELQERQPSPDVIIKLANVFHVSADYLLGIDDVDKKSLDVSGLTDEDISVLQNLIILLRKKSKH